MNLQIQFRDEAYLYCFIGKMVNLGYKKVGINSQVKALRLSKQIWAFHYYCNFFILTYQNSWFLI
jgi:hypothetical protein